MKSKAIIFTILVLLFIIPLTWFSNRAFDASGDDHKLQFFAPENYISNFSLYTWSSYNSLSTINLPYPNLYFEIFPFILKKIGFMPGEIEKIFYGLILSLSFLFTYFFIKELLNVVDLDDSLVFKSAVIGALIYSLSPLVIYAEWSIRLSSTLFGLFLFPSFLYFFLKAVNEKEIGYLILGALFASLFSFSIYVPIPWLIAFFIGIFIFYVTFFIMFREKRKTIIVYSLLYGLFIIGLNFSWIFILIDSLFFSKNIPMLASGNIPTYIVKEGADFVRSIAFNFSPLSAFLLTISKQFLDLGFIFRKYFIFKYPHFNIVLPLILIIALVYAKKELRKILLSTLIPAVILLYFLTVNITDIGVEIFASLIEAIPFFVIFRNFYGKFAVVFSFFYSVTIGISLALLFRRIRLPKIECFIIFIFIVVIVTSGMPLISGHIIGVSPSDAVHEKLIPILPESHFKALEYIDSGDDKNSRVFVFPLSFADYMCFKGENNQFYVAIPYIKILSGHDEFCGIWSFINLSYSHLPKIVNNLIDNYEYDVLSKILWLFNTKYIYIYEDIAIENAQRFLYKYNLINKMKAELLSKIEREDIRRFKDIEVHTIKYKQMPFHIEAKSIITEPDKKEWLSTCVYTDYLNSENRPLFLTR